MNLKTLGWARTLRGLREGNQAVLLTGLALILFQKARSSKDQRELIYRKKLPVGSTIVVRHARRGEPKIQIRRAEPDQTR
ncbi:MAG TPA: hypothetical protein VK070_00570 [Acidimicrobiia bacterium]|jgi:hypothetical protein|nr:hypothetical protein [Acidimicrobiia bacterium]